MNKTLNRFRLPLLIALAVSTAGLAGCGGDPEPAEPAAEAASADVDAVRRPLPGAGRREGPPVNMATGPQTESLPSSVDARYQVVPEVEGQLDAEGEGLQMILAATSATEFRDSLAQVASATSSEQYGELEQAIRFLIAYDPAVLGSTDQLHALVDGMTGEEVIARATDLAQIRYGNSPNNRQAATPPDGQ